MKEWGQVINQCEKAFVLDCGHEFIKSHMKNKNRLTSQLVVHLISRHCSAKVNTRNSSIPLSGHTQATQEYPQPAQYNFSTGLWYGWFIITEVSNHLFPFLVSFNNRGSKFRKFVTYQVITNYLYLNEKKCTGVIIVDTSMGIQIMLFCVTYLLSTICFSSVAVKSVRGSSQRNNHPPTVRLTSPNEIVITFVVSQRSVSILFISGGVAWLLDTSKLTDISKKAQVYESSIC